jgi:hypothetical protein
MDTASAAEADLFGRLKPVGVVYWSVDERAARLKKRDPELMGIGDYNQRIFKSYPYLGLPSRRPCHDSDPGTNTDTAANRNRDRYRDRKDRKEKFDARKIFFSGYP